MPQRLSNVLALFAGLLVVAQGITAQFEEVLPIGSPSLGSAGLVMSTVPRQQDDLHVAASQEGSFSAALNYQQDPPILVPGAGPALTLRDIGVVGDFPTIRFESSPFVRNQEWIQMTENLERTHTGSYAGYTISYFTKTWTADEIVSILGPRSFGVDNPSLGLGRISVPGQPGALGSPDPYLMVRALPMDLSRVPVHRINDHVQYSSHLVNLRVDGFSVGRITEVNQSFRRSFRRAFRLEEAANLFYTYFRDDYDSLAFVLQRPEMGLAGGLYETVRNEVAGIGKSVLDNSALYGSGGRLKGIEYFGAAHIANNHIASHELMHQWADFFRLYELAGVEPRGAVPGAHTPLLFPGQSFVGGLGPHEHIVRSDSGVYTMAIAKAPRQHPLHLYAMGLLAADQVPDLVLFREQRYPSMPGDEITGGTSTVTIDDIIRRHGPRVGPVLREWRRGVVLISTGGLLRQEEMNFWNFVAKRLSARADATDFRGVPSFYESVNRRMRLVTDIRPKDSPKMDWREATTKRPYSPHAWWGVVFDEPVPTAYRAREAYTLSGEVTDSATTEVLFTGDTVENDYFGGNSFWARERVGDDGRFSVTFRFPTAGSYKLATALTKDDGEVVFSARTGFLVSAPAALKASFMPPSTIRAGVPEVFDGSGSAGAESYSWDFGDGTVIEHPSTVSRPSHTYLEPGSYAVELEVARGGGCGDQFCEYDTATAMVDVLPPALTARLLAPSMVETGVAVVFDGSGSTSAESYSWEFGDGTLIEHPSTVSRPSHTYVEPGSYAVELEVARGGDCGAQFCEYDTATAMVDVLPPALTARLLAPSMVETGVAVVFDGGGSTSAESYSWDFGDGTVIEHPSTVSRPSHTYVEPGSYEVRLQVARGGDCGDQFCEYDTASAIVAVLPPPLTARLVAPSMVETGVAVVFDGGGSTGAESYSWDFGDGTMIEHPSTVSRPSHTYVEPGSYEVRLQVARGGDCGEGYCETETSTAVVEVEAGLPPVAGFELTAECEEGLCLARTGVAVTFRDLSSGTVAARQWDFGDGVMSTEAEPVHTWSSPGFYRVVLAASGLGVTSTVSRDILVRASDLAGTCEPDQETLCLQDSRYSVGVDWWTGDGENGKGSVVHAGTNDSGLFRFFDRDNWEILIKVLDGCAVNGHVWVYGASTTDLGYSIRVTDTVTGEFKEYGNEAGHPARAITESEAFSAACEAGGSAATSSEIGATDDPRGFALAPLSLVGSESESGCTDSGTSLCLAGERFEVTVDWSTADGGRGPASTVPVGTNNSGLFYFFDPGNWEMLIKVLDGCAINDHHWVYAASATDQGLEITVTDTMTQRTWKESKAPGPPAPAITDSEAFPDSCRP